MHLKDLSVRHCTFVFNIYAP